MKHKLNKLISGKFLFIIIVLATLFAFYKKATIWQQKEEQVKSK